MAEGEDVLVEDAEADSQGENLSDLPDVVVEEEPVAAGPVIQIEHYEKILLLGDFKTGKTTLGATILASIPRTLAFDPTWAIPTGKHSVKEALYDFTTTGHGVYQPYPNQMESGFDEFCTEVMKQENALIFIDEPALVMSSNGTIPLPFSALYRLGHKRGLGVMLATHRIHGDLPALTRIFDHLFCFRMTVDNDVKALAGYIGGDAAMYVMGQPNYYFYYRGTGNNVRQAFEPLPLNTPGAPGDELNIPQTSVPPGGTE